MMVRPHRHEDTGTRGLRACARYIFVAASAAIIFWATACCAQQVFSADLIADAAEHDGKTVVFEGEVIGDVMIRGDYAWVNVSDKDYAVGIWMRASDARRISHAGAYRVRGDTVRVRGVFHRSCSEHGGDLDIHAGEVLIVSPGTRLSAEPWQAKARLALGLALILGALWILKLFMKR